MSFFFYNFQAETHDRYRIGARYVREYRHIINFLIMMLPGVVCLYYGQEIGMVNGPVRPDQIKDPHIVEEPGRQRDCIRTPMQWDDSMNAGEVGNEIIKLIYLTRTYTYVLTII